MPLVIGRPNTVFNTIFASDSVTLTIGFPAYRSGSKKLLLSRIINFVYSWNKTPQKKKFGLSKELKSLIRLPNAITFQCSWEPNSSKKKKKKIEAKRSRQAETLLFHENMKNGEKKTSSSYSYKVIVFFLKAVHFILTFPYSFCSKRRPMVHVHLLNEIRKRNTLNYSRKVLKDQFNITDLKNMSSLYLSPTTYIK